MACTINISLAAQQLTLLQDNYPLFRAPVSTARLGPGESPGSFQTPRGLHSVCEKIGHNAPWGAVFKARVPTGDVWSPGDPPTDDDLILTRILWLDGLEATNRTTRDRFIYLHGTNQEHLIGSPASQGCIRLRNDDILALFDLVPLHTPVNIREG